MKRRILLVDDEVAVLLTLKAVLEINGFDVETAASAREARHLLQTREYSMIVTDMRMETDTAGADVIHVARNVPCQPAIAMLTAFPVAEEDWRDLGADEMLVKPMNTHFLLHQIEALLVAHEDKKLKARQQPAPARPPVKKKPVAKKSAAKKVVAKKAAKKIVRKVVKKAVKKAVKKTAPAKSKIAKKPVRKAVAKTKPAKKSARRK
jgi:DNA-binding response OmpR family regulator